MNKFKYREKLICICPNRGDLDYGEIYQIEAVNSKGEIGVRGIWEKGAPCEFFNPDWFIPYTKENMEEFNRKLEERKNKYFDFSHK